MDKLYKILQYIALIIGTYFIIRLYKPNNENIDTLIMAMIVTTIFAILENIYILYFKKSCSQTLNKTRENMSNTSELSESGSIDSASNSINTIDSSVASIISSSESPPAKITIESSNGQSSVYTQMKGGRYIKTNTTIPTTTPTITTTPTTSTITTTPTTTTSTSSDTQDVVSSTVTDDYEYDSVIAIAGVEGEIVTDYSPVNDLNRLPVSTLEYDYGYSFLPPKNWYPTPPNPPVCVSEKKCPVCPVCTNGTITDLKEWNESSKIA